MELEIRLLKIFFFDIYKSALTRMALIKHNEREYYNRYNFNNI